MLFAGCNYYPYGGWEDYQGTFETVEEAVKKLMGLGWAHIVMGGEIVKRALWRVEGNMNKNRRGGGLLKTSIVRNSARIEGAVEI